MLKPNNFLITTACAAIISAMVSSAITAAYIKRRYQDREFKDGNTTGSSAMYAGTGVCPMEEVKDIFPELRLPRNYDLASRCCVFDDYGAKGVLIKSRLSKMYQVFDGQMITSVDQDFARFVEKEFPIVPTYVEAD